jgi:hypothetical protein
VDRGDYFFRGWVNNVDGLAVDGLDKLIVDEPEGENRLGLCNRICGVSDYLQPGRLSVLATRRCRKFNRERSHIESRILMLWGYLRSVDFVRMKRVAKGGRGTVYRDVTIKGELGAKLEL